MGAEPNILYHLRKEKGFSMQEVASEMSITLNTLYKWENSLTRPSSRKVACLANIYGVDKEQIEDSIPHCIFPGCNKKEHQGGYCSWHYNNKYRTIKIDHIENASTLGDRLRLLREDKELSIEYVAKTFGVTTNTIEAWECNSVKPTLPMIVDVGSYYGVGTRLIERGIGDGIGDE